MSLLDSTVAARSAGFNSTELNRVTAETNGSEAETPWLTDADLIRRFLWRDEAAFTTLLERHGNMVLAVALRLVRDRHTAEDVFQATFLILARDASRIRQEGSVGAWLHGVAVRLARKALRRRSRQPLVSSELPEPATPDPFSSLEQTFDQQVLDEELARMPDGYREPLVLHFLEGLTYEETAQSLGTTVGAIEGRLKRGKRELRLRLMRRGVGMGVILATLHASQTAAVAGQSVALTQATVAGGMSTLLGTPFASALSAEALHLTRELAMWSFGKTLAATAGLLVMGMLGAALVAQGGGSPEGTGEINTAVSDSGGGSGGPGSEVQPGSFDTGTTESETGGSVGSGGGGAGSESGGGLPAPAERRAEFIRRIYMDLLGRLPSAEEVDAYVADVNPAATEKLMNRVLEMQEYQARHERSGNATGGSPGSGESLPGGYPGSPVGPGIFSGYPGTVPGPGAMPGMPGAGAPGMAGMMGSATPSPTKITVFKSKNPNVARIEEAMKGEAALDFQDAPLSDIVHYLNDQYQIPVIFDEEALTAEGVALDTQVNVVVSGVSLRSALKILFSNVGGVQLEAIVKDEVLVITTQSKADEELETRIYDVRSLQLEDPQQLVQILQTGTSGSWAEVGEGEGTISYAKGAFVIRQTQRVHAEIEALLETLNEHVQQAEGDVPNWPTPPSPPAGGGGFGGGGGGGGFG